ncbi:hypothetical protein [Pseudomonas sp. M47T1]|uniref:hypothetical protein n=1 Tax=Pseudomonas sp. M47T1 TaxID=1179778 RepID=UPI0002DE7B36|nr:hypothetical protein [Pseudomonas sp. M47T1]
MKIKIEKNNNDSTCLVWLNDDPVTFRNEEEAQAYVDQLTARLEAVPVMQPDAHD